MYTAQFKLDASPSTSDFTLVVGVSVGSPNFDNGQRQAILEAALANTRIQQIVLLVADTLQRWTIAMNQLIAGEATDTPDDLKITAKYLGDAWVSSCKEAIAQLQFTATVANKLDTVSYERWSALTIPGELQQQVGARYKDDPEFKTAVDKTVSTFLSRFLTQQTVKYAPEQGRRKATAKHQERRDALELSLAQIKQQLGFGEELQKQLEQFGFGDAAFKSMLTLKINAEKIQLLLSYAKSYVLEECAGLIQLGQSHQEWTLFAYPQREKSVPAFMKARELFLQPHNITALQYVEIELTKQYKKLQAPSHRTPSHTSDSSTGDDSYVPVVSAATLSLATNSQQNSSQARILGRIGVFHGPQEIPKSPASALQDQGLFVTTVTTLVHQFRDDPNTFARFMASLTGSPTTPTVAGVDIIIQEENLLQNGNTPQCTRK